MPTPSRRPVLRQLLVTTLSAVAAVLLYLRSTRPQPPAVHRSELAHRMCRNVTLELTDQPLGEALRRLSEQLGVPFDVDWTTLANIEVTPETLVSPKLRDVDGATALTVLLREATNDDNYPYPIWGERDGRVVVGNPAALSAAVVRVYDVRDLLDEDAAFRRAMPNEVREAHDAMRSVTYGWPQEKPREESIEDIEIILMNAVDDSTWIDHGGTIGRMYYAFDRLVIAQTPENHEAIQRVLAALRLRGPATAAHSVTTPESAP